MIKSCKPHICVSHTRRVYTKNTGEGTTLCVFTPSLGGDTGGRGDRDRAHHKLRAALYHAQNAGGRPLTYQDKRMSGHVEMELRRCCEDRVFAHAGTDANDPDVYNTHTHTHTHQHPYTRRPCYGQRPLSTDLMQCLPCDDPNRRSALPLLVDTVSSRCSRQRSRCKSPQRWVHEVAAPCFTRCQLSHGHPQRCDFLL